MLTVQPTLRYYTRMEPKQEIRAIRTSLNISQAAISKALGIPRSQYADYELGRIRLPADIYVRVKAMMPNKKRDRAGTITQ